MAMASPGTSSRILADLTQRMQQSAPATSGKIDTDNLDWQDYSADELPNDLRQMYDDRLAAQRLARELEAKFETAFNDRLRQHKLIPADETMLVSYRFGKFRCATVKTSALARKGTAKPTAVFGFKRG